MIDEIKKVGFEIIKSFELSDVFIIGLASWLGKIWGSRVIEKEKKEHKKDIEKYKNQLEELKRYSGKQSDLYNQLWQSFCVLENFADLLWEKATPESLNHFVTYLKKTEKDIKESYLFIEDEHYNKLLDLLNSFSEYQGGKNKLLSHNFKRSLEIEEIIKNNEGKREEYKKLIKKVGENFKKQLRGNK